MAKNEVPEIKWASPTETVVFLHNGEQIKRSINRKLVEQLEPKYVRYMNKIREALKADQPDVKDEDAGMAAAALVVAMFQKEPGSEATWLRFLCEMAAETLESIDSLRALDRSIITNALYTIDRTQAKAFGL